jgi:putative serine protease PepD
MESGGFVPNEEGPEEAEGDDGLPMRGWIPPDDRLWRHPSEIAEPAPAARLTATARPSRPVVVVGAVGAVAVVVAVAAITLGATGPASPPIAATVTSLTTATSLRAGSLAVPSGVGSPTSADVIGMVEALRPSLVAVVAAGAVPTQPGDSPESVTGVVLPGGHLVLTAASAVVGMYAVDVVTFDGAAHRGIVIGSDAHSGVAVVSVSDQLSPASFDDEDVAAGALGISACLCSGAARAGDPQAAPTVSLGVVRRSGQPVGLSDGTTLLDAIEATTPLDPGSWGAVLLDHRGQVAGILDSEQASSTGTVGVFVPASLAVDVAHSLAGSSALVHGWLGVACTDRAAGGQSGPEVTTVFAGGPAAHAGVEVGDVVVAVDGHDVATVAELQARLYVLGPGADAKLLVARGADSLTVSATLAAEPG